MERYRSGSLPRSSALALLVSSFPYSAEQADEILGPEPDGTEPRPPSPAVSAPVVAPPSLVDVTVPEDEDAEEEETEDDEEADVEAGETTMFGLSRVKLGPGEAENVATEIAEGEILYGEAGIHAHEVFRALEQTGADGAHAHVFQLPSGLFIATELDGMHQHRLADVDADETMEDGKHGHAVIMGGQVLFTGEEVSAHRHTLQVEATAVDGAHRHTLQVPNPENTSEMLTITSLSAGEFAAAMREGALPAMIDDVIPGTTAVKRRKRNIYGGGGSKKDKKKLDGADADVVMGIKKMPNGKFRVTKEDGTGNFGEFDKREDAVERLGEVEGFKARASAKASAIFDTALAATDDAAFSVALAVAAETHAAEMSEWREWVNAGHVHLALDQDQPGTSNGSPEDYVLKGMRELTNATAEWAQAFEAAVADESTAVGIFGALQNAHSAAAVDKFGRGLERRKLQALMLGVLDNVRDVAEEPDAPIEDTVAAVPEAVDATADELETDTSAALDDLDNEAQVLVARFQRATVLCADGEDFTKMPFKRAVQFFKGLNVLDRASFERAQAAIKQRSFTVAGIMRDQMLRTLQDELVKAIQDGDDLRNFRKRIKPRLQQAGFMGQLGTLKDGKKALNASHVETVFRTNVLNTYNTGRYIHQTSPKVVAAFPVWEMRALPPTSPADRKTHFAANGTMLMANDPFWATAYPPYGFNCRCRVVARSRKFLSKVVPGTTVRGLPDPGFTSGRPALALG